MQHRRKYRTLRTAAEKAGMDEKTARQDMADAKKEAASARAEAARIDPTVISKAEAKLAEARIAAIAPNEAYARERGILRNNRITCEMRPRNCPPLREKAAMAEAKIRAAKEMVLAAKATIKIRNNALARAVAADTKAGKAKTWLASSQNRQEATKTTETAGIHTMIAHYWGLNATHVARIDGLGEAIARLAFTLALSLCATPGAMLIGAAWQDFHRKPEYKVISQEEVRSVAVQPETVTIIDKNNLRPLVLRVLQEHGPAESQKELARRLALYCDAIERVAASTLSDVLAALEEAKEIKREQAGPAKIVTLANWNPRRRA